MATKNKASDGHFATYKANKTWEKNRKARLERTLKAQPTNQQVKDALKGGLVYRRKTPTKATWSHSAKAAAQLYKMFNGNFDMNIMSYDPKLQHAATQKPVNPEFKAVKETSQYKSFFALGARLQGIR
jgi:hypothetical protein